jgi:exopolysaccharide production protein ExoZ
MQAAASPKRIDTIEIGRGLAALAVLMLHGEGMKTQYFGTQTHRFFTYGFLGVDFFFVLSGFIIYFVHKADIGKPAKARDYLIKRTFRIYPAYLAVLALFIASIPFQNIKPDISALSFISELAIFNKPPLIGQAWTLQHELVFYAVFLLCIVSKYIGGATFVTWIATCIFYHAGKSIVPNETWFDLLVHPFNAFFALGGLTAFVYSKGGNIWRNSSFVFLLLGLLAGLAIFYLKLELKTNSYLRYFLSGLVFNAIMVALLLSSKYLTKIPKPIAFLADISYASYISHAFVIMITYTLMGKLKLFEILPQLICFFIAVVACIIAAYGLHRVIELPSLRFGRQLTQARPH